LKGKGGEVEGGGGGVERGEGVEVGMGRGCIAHHCIISLLGVA